MPRFRKEGEFEEYSKSEYLPELGKSIRDLRKALKEESAVRIKRIFKGV